MAVRNNAIRKWKKWSMSICLEFYAVNIRIRSIVFEKDVKPS